VARPRIGLAAYWTEASWTYWKLPVALVPAGYVEGVRLAGGLPLILPPTPEGAAEPGEVLDAIDGLLLIGGPDLGVDLYGSPEAHPETGEKQERRDAFELALLLEARSRKLPLLGICRGMQLLNVALGGTLVQHLPDDVGHSDHRRSLGSFDNADHDVRLTPGSLAARAAGETLHATKSHHHQGVDRLGEGIEATGWSVLDELVEAIEVADARWALGVQWHPEADPRSGVVAAFAGEAARVAVEA
jgi:putative glutamine amidotransferase